MPKTSTTKAEILPNAGKKSIIAGGIFGFTGVALGAFGAHALKGTLEANGYLEVWKTAVFYQLIHAVGLLILAALARSGFTSRFLSYTTGFWVAGIFCFSGSLYILALGGPKWLGPITPLGGLCFLVGWAMVTIMGLKRP